MAHSLTVTTLPTSMSLSICFRAQYRYCRRCLRMPKRARHRTIAAAIASVLIVPSASIRTRPRATIARTRRHYRPGRSAEKTPPVALSRPFWPIQATAANSPAQFPQHDGRERAGGQAELERPARRRPPIRARGSARAVATRGAAGRVRPARALRRGRDAARSRSAPSARHGGRAAQLARADHRPGRIDVECGQTLARDRPVHGSGPKIECVPASIQTSPSSAAVPARARRRAGQHRVEQQRARGRDAPGCSRRGACAGRRNTRALRSILPASRPKRCSPK